MNDNLKALYVVIHDNKVIAFETNLKLFVQLVNDRIEGSRNYDYYYRKFKVDKHFLDLVKGKEYYFQKLL